MRQPLAHSPDYPGDDAPLAVSDHSGASKVDLRLLLEKVQGSPGIFHVVAPGKEVLKRLDLRRCRLRRIFRSRIWRARPNSAFIVAQTGNALLSQLIRNLTVQVGCELARLVAISINRPAARDDNYARYLRVLLMCGNN